MIFFRLHLRNSESISFPLRVSPPCLFTSSITGAGLLAGMAWSLQRWTVAAGAPALALAGVLCIWSAAAPSPALLFGEFPWHTGSAYRPAVSAMNLVSPSPLDYHTFDYSRPDLATSMDMNLMTGNVGMPSYSFAGKAAGRSQSLARGRGPHWGRQSLGAHDDVRGWAQTTSKDVSTNGPAEDRRDLLDNEERAAVARCNGMLHACVRWMNMETGKMRVITYGTGSWCTDDDTLSRACYDDAKPIQQDVVLDIPGEGQPVSSQLWSTIQQSCPLVADCPQPRGWSTTEEHSVYTALPTILTEYLQLKRESCWSCAHRLLARQRSLLARRSQRGWP